MAGSTVVFCDIVEFSTRDNDSQKEIIYALNAEVTHELFRHLSGVSRVPRIISLPTGDGMAIALLDTDEEETSWKAVLLRLIHRLMNWAKSSNANRISETKIRIGVHVGPVSLITDINRQPNLCGATINHCQRIMDAAHPNQVLFSDTAYRHYIGTFRNQYSEYPFTEEAPARFSDRSEIIGKHGLTIGVHIMHHDKPDSHWTNRKPYPRGDILGKQARTQFIVDRFDDLRMEKRPPFVIYEQSAFSTMGIAPDQTMKDDPGSDDEYVDLRRQQRERFETLAALPGVSVRLILNFKQDVTNSITSHRAESVLDWMKTNETNDEFDWVHAKFRGPNRLMIEDEFCIEGYRLSDTSGYELSIVHYEKHRIVGAINEFDRLFNQVRNSGVDKRSVMKELEKLCKAAKCPVAPKIVSKAKRRQNKARNKRS